MKKITALVLVFALAFNVFVYAAQRANISNHDVNTIPNIENYETYTITFEPVDNVMESLKSSTNIVAESKFNQWGKENIKEIKQYIKSLDLKNRGYVNIEDLLFANLSKVADDGGYIDSYTIYLPKEKLQTSEMITNKSGAEGSYYGTYNGFMFTDAFVEFTDSYFKYSYEEQKIKQWAQAIYDLVMIFMPKTLNISAWVLSNSTRNNIQTFSVECVMANASDRVTQHYINIQDGYCYIGNDPDYYITVIIDEYRINTTQLTTMYDTPDVLNDHDVISYQEHVVCSTWSQSKNSQMSRGYNEYIYGGGRSTDLNLVGRFSMGWK